MIASLVYIRKHAATVITNNIIVKVPQTIASRFCGFAKFGATPGGGLPAGPFKSVFSSIADSAEVDDPAMFVSSRRVK